MDIVGQMRLQADTECRRLIETRSRVSAVQSEIRQAEQHASGYKRNEAERIAQRARPKQLELFSVPEQQDLFAPVADRSRTAINELRGLEAELQERAAAQQRRLAELLTKIGLYQRLATARTPRQADALPAKRTPNAARGAIKPSMRGNPGRNSKKDAEAEAEFRYNWLSGCPRRAQATPSTFGYGWRVSGSPGSGKRN